MLATSLYVVLICRLTYGYDFLLILGCIIGWSELDSVLIITVCSFLLVYHLCLVLIQFAT